MLGAWVMCSQRTDNVTNGGDSGAPFFIPYNAARPTQTPAVVGTLFAVSGGNNSWLSPISQIDRALGAGAYFWY